MEVERFELGPTSCDVHGTQDNWNEAFNKPQYWLYSFSTWLVPCLASICLDLQHGVHHVSGQVRPNQRVNQLFGLYLLRMISQG